ncbi:FtsK/SpoIIIE domain-containing protein [Aromatoleum evansii]|uniref:FtsK/SpoIIIE domain-containing protein n=1 Tax=Aromatoleum evansii TaxID=59406 RepID=A0ABZ1AQ57_AROEV|nr:FtsK/SpoIIIE domain-containing protein [Aromatoleum evansii]
MNDLTTAMARLAQRRIEERFQGDESSPMLRVTCLEPAEITALVQSLRRWRPPAHISDVRIAVTVKSPWPGLESGEMVPREDVSPTTLRNLRGVSVILIVGDDFTDKQSWQKVHPISDTSLIAGPDAREHLVQLGMGDDPPGLVIDVLEEVHAAVRADGDESVPVRKWVSFVLAVCRRLEAGPLGAEQVWSAVGASLPEIDLFPDESLATLARTDRMRRLRRNRSDSHRLLYEADDRWRDVLQDRVGLVELLDSFGRPEANQELIREALERLLGANGGREQRNVQFRHWLRIVEPNGEKAGIGNRIREHLEAIASDRVQEYDDLGVATGIDAGNADDAQKLLDALPPRDELPPLVRLLTDKQVVAIERMANPRALSTRAPLAEILRVVAEMVSERVALLESRPTSNVELIVEPRKLSETARHSRGLFAWLFEPALRQITDELQGERVSLSLAPELAGTELLKGFERTDSAEDDDFDLDGAFDTLELRLRWSDASGREQRIDWNPRETPGLVALWRLTSRPDVTSWKPGVEVSLDTWLTSATQRAPMVGECASDEGRGAVVETWRRMRRGALAEIAERGLSPDLIDEYAARYHQVLATLRNDHVPTGAPRAEVTAVLGADLYRGNGTAVMLATHPIRLRWIAAYLRRLQDLILKALRSELLTNPVNPDLFFSQLLAASPQGQPPVAVVDEQLCVAIREQDWHEVLAPLKDERGERRDWLADLDDGAIDDVAETIGRYLDAYPHKADGLHLLYIVRRHGARSLHRLVKNVFKRINVKGTSLKLTLCVDPCEIRNVEEVLQDFDDADHRAYSDRPPIQVSVQPWENPERSLPDLSGIGAYVDLAVVPNLFGASTRTHDSTRDGRLDTGTFDPLLDEPTRLEAVGSGDAPSAAVSRVLLPAGRDDLLEAWSTITTRQFRGSPVSESPSEHDVDHVTIQVSLDKNRGFFDALHTCAHWVLTVDAFVGREQIEALENGPDVIRVKTGVGANGAYRLVVSSKSGRRFVESRIARRLRQQIPHTMLPDTSPLARTIYDRARLLVPGIVLRSLGLGRTAAEMVGLVLARARIEQKEPAMVGPYGFQTWLSLDEHPEWSGGHQALRADLARIRGWFDGRILHLLVDVVEAKMRTEVAVGRADRQLDRSIQLLRAALGGAEDGLPGCADVPMWRRLIWRAIEQTSMAADAIPAATHIVTDDGRRATLGDKLRAALRQGEIVVESVKGVLVSMVDGHETEDAVTPNGHRWMRLTLDEAKHHLIRLSDEPQFPLSPRAETCAMQEHVEMNPPGPVESDSLDRDHVEPAPPVPPVPRPERGGRSEAAIKRMDDLVRALYARNVEVSPESSDDAALEGPGFFLLRVKLGSAYRPQHVSSLAEDLQYHLHLDAGQVPRIYVDRGAVVIEIPKREHERYYVDAAELWGRTRWPSDKLYAPLGYDVRDEPVGIDFSSSRSPHLLIGGMTGGGKSVALETLLLGLVGHYPASKLELRIVDPKGNEFAQFEKFDHLVEAPGMDAEDAIEMLRRTCEEMDARYRAMKELSREHNIRIRDIAEFNEIVGPAEQFKWIVVVLDEFADLTADKDDKKAIEALLQRIAQKARACGIHAIVATQKPSAEVISTTTRSNLGAQLALRVRSSTDSRVIMDATGAESLAGNGDAFLRLSGEEPVRLQCAKVLS